MQYTHVKHEFEPVYDSNSKVLILGTFPSVKSREQNFYYGHKQNRFWKLIAKLTSEDVPHTIEEKKNMLLKHHIAIWDVVSKCDIKGSSDSSIKNVVAADIKTMLKNTDIIAIYGNGAKACQLYDKYVKKSTGIEIIKLPSTSPANAAYSIEKLEEKWKEILKITKL